LCIVNLFKTTFTDPGVIPRGDLESAEKAMELGINLDNPQESKDVQVVVEENSGKSIKI